MNIKLVGILFAVGSLLACGDSGTGGSGGGTGGNPSSGGSNPGGSNPGGGTGEGAGTSDGGGGGGAALTCQTGCEALFACGLEGTPQYCPGFTPADEDTFVPGCVDGCANMMALLAFIDPSDCEGTVTTIKGLSADEFAPVCENGFGQGGAGGGI